jgi:DNA-binding transcriptional ArsR family regulator
MADTEDTRGPQEPGELDEALLKAISHPLRHRVLSMLDQRVASPNEISRELGLPLGRVSYHVRLLHDLGAIELVRTEPRRGALEHFYTAVMRAWFNEEEWARLPRAARRGILGQNLQRIFSEVSAALDDGGFDNPASHVLRTALLLDGEGLAAVSDLLTASLARAQEINSESAARVALADEPELFATELAMLHFGRPA